MATLRLRQRRPTRPAHGPVSPQSELMPKRQAMKPTEQSTAASATTARGRPSMERPRVNSIHNATPTMIAVPTLVSAISRGGRAVGRTPPLARKITSAPRIPHPNSQARARAVSRCVGAGTSETD